jgi:hypothetical protein
MANVESLIEDFVKNLSGLLESETLDRARAAVESALGGGKRGPGRPPKTAALTLAGKPRKKPPRQHCPVPGCKNPAAPVFGMVCAKHKDVPKAKIKKYREARRAKKLGVEAPKARRAPKARKAPKKMAKTTAKKPTRTKTAAKKPTQTKTTAKKPTRTKAAAKPPAPAVDAAAPAPAAS